MKTRLTLLILLVHSSIFAQSVYYDAYLIKRYSTQQGAILTITPGNKTEADSVLTVLHKYFPEIDTLSTAIDMRKLLHKNPFFANATYGGGTKGTERAPNLRLPMGGALSAIGGLDVTTIADGLAKFIVKRTKAELNMAFFSKFKDLLSKTEYKDLQTVFPQTYTALNVIGDEIYNYNAYLQTLRDAFKNDLSSLNTHLPSIIENHPDFFNAYPYLGALLHSGCYIAEGINDKVHPGDILNDYPDEYLDPLNPNLKATIKTLKVVSASLRENNSSDSSYWVSIAKIKALAKDSITFRIYMGLLYQQFKNDSITFWHFGDSTTLTSMIDTQAQSMLAYKSYVTKFGEKTQKLSRMIRSYQKMSTDSLTVEQYTAYFDASVDLLEYASQASDLAPKKWAGDTGKQYLFHLKDTLKDYFDVAHATSHLIIAVNRRNYCSAIMNAATIYDIVYSRISFVGIESGAIKKINDKEYKSAIKLLRNAGNEELVIRAVTHRLSSADLNNATIQPALKIISAKLTFDEAARSKEVLHSILRYGTFMAAMATAETGDEVEKAIESFALPPGSSRIKRETPFNVSVNAYAGIFAGYEQIEGLKSDRCIQLNTYGVTAPIGIAISRGHKRFLGIGNAQQKHWSYSAFVSIIDLGAVAAFRFNNDTATTSQIPKIQLKDIISPGLFLSIGIPKCPISINLGTQIGPNLRSVSTSGNNLSNNIYWRHSISFVVDIPMLNLYTRSAN